MGEEELKWHQLAHHHKDLILVHTVQLKPMIKAHFSERTLSSGVSDIAFTSVHSEKTHLMKLMKKLQETTIFSGHQKLTSAMKLRM